MTTQDYKDAAKKLKRFSHESRVLRKDVKYLLALRFWWYMDCAILGGNCSFEEYIEGYFK